MEVIDQQVINDNKEIYAKIQSELLSAEFEILIATAWFTDEDLFNILIVKLAEGVHIEVIVADNQENEKLDFELLAAKGAAVHKIKNSGYGIMNQKFCVIDKRIALHGSYNWSVNAKKNNQESIISTNHQETIEALIDNFNVIKTRIQEQKQELASVIQVPVKTEKPKGIPVEIPLKAGAEFEKLLDSMIAAEVGNFDREMLRKQGFERCNANNGDHQVLYKSFDTLYSMFINDIDVIEDKKKRLIAKIDEHKVKNQDILTKNCELQTAYLEKEQLLDNNNLENQRTQLNATIEKHQKNIAEIATTKIGHLDTERHTIEEEIKKTERDFARPKLKWFELIPTIIFNVALLCYLFIFYSSAAYILLFSLADAKEAEAKGISLAEAQVFNPDAISKALHKSGSAPYFIFLFVFIPLAFAVMDRFITGKWVPYLSFIGGILVLDVAIAYKVTQAVYQVNYARGNVNVLWHTSMAFTDTNFYLVFIFGAFGLLLFKLAFKKLMGIFEERSPDMLAQRAQILIKQLKIQLQSIAEKILAHRADSAALELEMIECRAELKTIGLELEALPITLNQELQKQQSQLLADLKMIDEIAAIYTAHIQSDNLPISVDALKDRINVFLEGWNDCLCDEYSVLKASGKTREAAEVAHAWQQEKIQINKIDKRVKVHSHE